MAFEILNGITSADIAFRVSGKDLAELFHAGARALTSIMLQNPETIESKTSVTFDCAAENLDMLYFDFLNEFIYYKDSKKLILLPEKIQVIESAGGYSMTCQAKGEKIDRTRHLFNVDIKAITTHNLRVVKKKNRWFATVVVDV
jgi:SHS2 domain-containing protein